MAAIYILNTSGVKWIMSSAGAELSAGCYHRPDATESDMAVIISMLRGVNVGGHNVIKMEELRALYASLKLRDAQTYVQSGNVIFRTD